VDSHGEEVMLKLWFDQVDRLGGKQRKIKHHAHLNGFPFLQGERLAWTRFRCIHGIGYCFLLDWGKALLAFLGSNS